MGRQHVSMILALLTAAAAVGRADAGVLRSAAAPPLPGAVANAVAGLACCVPLGPSMQLRYAKPPEPSAPGAKLEFALVGAVPEGSWLGWGPADPGASSRLMGSADCAAGGLAPSAGSGAALPWASDLFLSGYAPCDTTAEPASGVCPDAVLNADPTTGNKLVTGGPAAAAARLGSVKLLAAAREGGVTAVRMRRPLAAADVLDHPVDPKAALNYVWAHGPLAPPGPKDPALRLQQHGAAKDSYGVLSSFKLADCPSDCPAALVPAKAPPPAPPPAPAPASAPAPPAGGAAGVALAGGGARASWVAQKSAAGAPGLLVSLKATKPSQWAALGVGKAMDGARAYVVWRDAAAGGALRTGVYQMSGYDAASIKPLGPLAPPASAAAASAAPHGGVASARSSPEGVLSFEAWVPLEGGAKSLPLLWALGNNWGEKITDASQHFASSPKATTAEVSQAAAPAAAAPAAAKAPRAPIPGCPLKEAFELAKVGDGWCDAGPPYNTAECLWDGGDCCNTGAPLFDCQDPKSPSNGKASPRGLRFPAPRNPRYSAGMGRVLSTHDLVTSYNNFYEFSTEKLVFTKVTPAAREAMEIQHPKFSGWQVIIDGLVAKPMTVDVRDLINMFHIEERIYRHRCVEAWSIVVPWDGFPLRKLLAAVAPLPGAKYVRFETGTGPWMPNALEKAISPGAPEWPYVEGLTLQEAMNDLAFVSIGQFNGTLKAQSGAPIRINVPWKYGFKSIKSLRRISLVAQQPKSYWEEFNPDEYGFWANINPKYRHRRWSQAQEQELVDSPSARGVIRTTIYNGYGAEVGHMYDENQRLYYF